MPLNRTVPLNQDRGSALMFAIGILALIAVLGAVTLANARADVRHAARVVDRVEAGSLVDVAVAAAWAEIVDGATSGFGDSGTTPTGSWSFDASPVDPNRWTISARGGDGEDESAASVVVAREFLAPYTLLAVDISTGPLAGRVDGRVGITGAASFGGRSMGTVQELIGPAASCVGCRNPVVVEIATERATVAPGSGSLPCPEVGGVISGTISAGDYDCTAPGPLTMNGTIDVSGPVLLELGPDVDLDLAAASVNSSGRAQDLVISQPTAGGAAISSDGAAFRGVLLAPETPMTSGDLRWWGSLDVASFVASPGATIDGAWDPGVEDLGLSGWVVLAWDVQPA